VLFVVKKKKPPGIGGFYNNYPEKSEN